MINLNQNSNIRRIDELGRLVIPKDIRKKLHIKDNEPLEIYIDNDEIKIKKYSALPDIIEYIKYIADLGNRITKNEYIITDRNNIIASSKKELEGSLLSEAAESFVLSGTIIKSDYLTLDITSDFKVSANFNIIPILIDNDRSGIIIEYNENVKLTDNYVINIFKYLIEKKLNNC